MKLKDVERILSNVRASMAQEGLDMSELSEELGRKYLIGEISSEKVIEEITRYIKNKQSAKNT